MANVDRAVTRRVVSILIGSMMFFSSVYLVDKVPFNLFEMIATFNPYILYYVGLILGAERIIFGITNNKRLYYLLMGEGDLAAYVVFSMFFFGIFMGLYIGIYALFLQGLLVKIAEVVNGVSYILFAIALWSLP
ncbi:hypothetical protein L3N51_00883 [Metallosphaera sp. J1]|uniref:hypothetical protein n=1 Tax=Metallosphaera TaxID=41980 RepID=UPI001EDF9083|nr:hypothetical protein [Metallosphaera javensis (ex Hofmann et al. 2022)]MCG3108599.1 hypothetical protein [Metallosphaera javensis (ex Hofmann et al. 2022)]BCS91712.1 MAG: hypothetical protein MjAS7_0320 [Metallosphaera javensis (ex Sakai et al. 2022)]